MNRFGLTREEFDAATIVWDYHQLEHPPQTTEVGVVLGCHDIGVCDTAADLYHAGRVPLLIVTGATSPSTRDRFPQGEADAFAARLTDLAVPASAVLIEEKATNTGQNIQFSRALLAAAGITPATVTLVCMPYMERRAWATCTAQWPEVDACCASTRYDFADYLELMQNRDDVKPREVIEMMIGDFQRILLYPALGFAVEQPVTEEAYDAFTRLAGAGFDAKLLPG